MNKHADNHAQQIIIPICSEDSKIIGHFQLSTRGRHYLEKRQSSQNDDDCLCLIPYVDQNGRLSSVRAYNLGQVKRGEV